MVVPEDIENKINNLKDNDYIYIESHEESGALIKRKDNLLVLLEIPLYGGEEQVNSSYELGDAKQIINVIKSWQ